MNAALGVDNLKKTFGHFVANDEITLHVEQGARHALIGPNGAGKTTLVNVLSGFLRPSSGRISLYDQDVTLQPIAHRVAAGLVRTFQVNQLFPSLTALEAVILAVSQQRGAGARWFQPVGRDSAVVQEAAAALDTFGLLETAYVPISELAYGQQRLLDMVLALALKPRVLLLDEPSAGVPQGESTDIIDAIAALPADVTVLLIEHDMDIVLRFADRITVLVGGKVFADGSPAEIMASQRVRDVYLGEGRG